MSQAILVEQAAPINTPSPGQLAIYADNGTFPRLVTMDDAGNPSVLLNGQIIASVAQATGFSGDTYLAGSKQQIPVAGKWRAGTVYRCRFDMAKTAAGVATPTIIVRIGLAGTTSDAAALTFTLAAGTAAVDLAWLEVFVNFRTVGSGSTAVMQGLLNVFHQAASGTGLTSTADKGLNPFGVATSTGFNSTTQTFIGVSFNGGASFSGTHTIAQSDLSL